MSNYSSFNLDNMQDQLNKAYQMLNDTDNRILLASSSIERAKLEKEANQIRQYIQRLRKELSNYEEMVKWVEKIKIETGEPVKNLMEHYDRVIGSLLKGQLVIVLGTGVNLVGRPPGLKWSPKGKYPPTQEELAQHLANRFGFQSSKEFSLSLVSQYAAAKNKYRYELLYDELREIFEENKYEPLNLHKFFAKLPSFLRAKVVNPSYPIFVTTSYDNLLEKAFDKVSEAYDLLAYFVDEDNGSQFLYSSSSKKEYYSVDDVADYMNLKQRPVILKMHRVPDPNFQKEYWLVSEDQFINYMTRTEIERVMPAKLMGDLRNGNLLFLGYNVYDWSLRTMLYCIWGKRRKKVYSYAVESHRQELNPNFWIKWEVEVVQAELKDYLTLLIEQLNKLPSK